MYTAASLTQTSTRPNASIASPPSLVALASALDCSPFHLSRVFRATTGLGLRQYLRRLRVLLANDAFVRNAPAAVVARERERLADLEQERAQLAGD